MISQFIFRNKLIIPAVFIFIISSGVLFAQATATVSGAGTVAVNGVYTEAGTANGRPYFTMGIYRIEYRDGGFGVEWEIWDTNEANPSLEVKYFNASTNLTPPAAGWQVDVATVPAPTLSVVTNQAPVLAALEGTTLTYTENDAATAITSLITVSDNDDTNMESATIQITTNYQNGQDVLSFTNQNGITGTWTAATGTMALSGSTTTANYQTALRDIKYSNSSENPNTSTRTVSFTVNDGDDNSNTQTRDISVASVNDDPTMTGLPTDITVAEDVQSDVDISAANLIDVDAGSNSVTLTISAGSGIFFIAAGSGLTLTGQGSGTITITGTVANINTYLDQPTNIKYLSPSNANGDNYTTLTLSVNDGGNTGTGGGGNISLGTVNVDITTSNDAPELAAIEGTALTYTEGDAATLITITITVADADDTNIESATIQITTNYQNGQDVLSFTNQLGITGTWTAATGTLSLSGSSSLANYQTALRDVKYNNTSNIPNTSNRTVSFTVNDGDDISNTSTRQISVTSVNEAPVLAAIEGTTLTYTENDAATAITSLITVSDNDDTNMESATIQITTNYQNGQDVLSFTNQNGITGTWTAATGTMALSGSTTTANYQTALRDIKYSNSSENPNTSTRTVSFTVNDGDDNSNTQTRDISVASVNDDPTMTGLPTDITVAEDVQSDVDISAANLIDVDAGSNSVTLTISAGSGIFFIAAGSGLSLTGNVSGTITMTGTVANINNYLDQPTNIKYLSPTNANGDNYTTLTLSVNDGGNTGTGGGGNISLGSVNVDITASNDAPVLASIEGTTLAYTEGDAATSITSTITVADADDTNIESATIQITGNYQNGQDVLSFTNQNGITGTWTAATGTMALSGSATKAFYQTALRDVKYNNTSNNPNTSNRTVSFTVNDGDDISNTSTRQISVTSVNDDPTISGLPTDITVIEDVAGNFDISAASIADVDAGANNITLTITAGVGTLSAVSGGGVTITGSGTGTLTLTGTVSNIDTYLNTASNIKYTSVLNVNGNDATTLTLTANDGGNTGTGGGNDVSLGTVNVDITAVNDPPVVSNVFGDNTTEVIAGSGAQNITDLDDATVTNNDSPDYNSGFLTIAQISGTTNGNFGVDGTTVTSGGDGTIAAGETIAVSGTSIGNVHATDDGQGGNNLQIDFNSANSTDARIQSLIRSLTYSAPSGLGERVFNLTLNDKDGTANGGDEDASGNFTITVTPNPPILGNIDGDNATIPVGGAKGNIDVGGNATVTDADSPNFNGGNLTITQNTGTANGSFSVTGSGASGVASGPSLGTADQTIIGSEIIYVEGVAIASVSAVINGQSGNDLVLNFGSNATPTRTQQVIRALQYAAPSGPGTRTFTISLRDAGTNDATGSANFTITITPPEIDLKQGTTAIADGDSFNYGNKALNSDNDITFTIHNTAAGVLAITTPITLAGVDAGQFSIQQQPGATVAANDSTTFIVRFKPTSAGAKTASIEITNNDADENPYNITLNGSGNSLPTGGNDAITMNEDATYTFSASDFTFNDPDTDTFAGIQLQSLETTGTLTYDGIDVVTLLDYSDVSKLIFTPSLNGSGSPYATFTFKVKDSNGGHSAATYTMTINVNAKPTVTIDQASGQSDPANSSTINFTVVFSESVTGFSTGDVTLSGTTGATTGTVIETAPNNGTTYNVAVTGMNASGTVIATIAAGVASDAGGAVNRASTSTDNSVAYDASAPSGYSVSVDQSFINSNNQNAVSFTFSSAEGGATYNYSFSSSGGGSAVTGSGTITSTNQQITGVDLSGLIDGVITLSVTLTDPLGNTGNAATDTKTKDTVQPTVSITSTASNPTNTSPFTVTIDFSEGAVGFTLSDIIVSNGNAGNFQVVNSAQYKADITPESSGTVSVNIAANVAQDLAGNNNTAATQYSVIYDNIIPTGYSVSIDQPVINLDNKESISFTFAGAEVGTIFNYTFSSSSGGTNATGSGTITTSSQQITNINLSGLDDGTITLSVTLTDIVGNAGNPAADTKIKDTIQPELSITTAETNVKNNVPFTVEINFSETVTGFDAGDIVVGNGLLSSFTIITSSKYTVDVTPLTLGTVTVDIGGSVAKDIAGNDNSAAVGFSIIATNNAPVLAEIEGTALYYTEKDAATAITNTLTVNDFDDENMFGASVSISGNYRTGQDILSFTNQNGINGNWNAVDGTITFNGKSTKANYETALRSVKYFNTSNNPTTLTRTISFSVEDSISNSIILTRHINITSINDSPVISFKLSPPSVNEDESIAISLSEIYPFISDPDNSIKDLEISYEYPGSHFTITETSDSIIIIEPIKNWYGLDSITVKVTDGHSTVSAPFAINVISVNDLPEFINLPETINLIGSGPIALDVFNIVNDVETPNDLLTFEFSRGNDSLLFNYDSENGILNLSAVSGYEGKLELTIKATDEEGGIGETSIVINVFRNVTGVEELAGQIPKDYELYQNYPNPFNPSTIIRYGLPEESRVVIRIYNILGQEVRTLFDGIHKGGYHEETFNGSGLASGMYIYSVVGESTVNNKKYSQVKKMLFVK